MYIIKLKKGGFVECFWKEGAYSIAFDKSCMVKVDEIPEFERIEGFTNHLFYNKMDKKFEVVRKVDKAYYTSDLILSQTLKNLCKEKIKNLKSEKTVSVVTRNLVKTKIELMKLQKEN